MQSLKILLELLQRGRTDEDAVALGAQLGVVHHPAVGRLD